MLKCTNELQPFCESIGLKRVTKKSKWLDIPEVKTHYEEMQATKLFHCYIIESNVVVDHKSKTFINHIDQMLGNQML